MTRLTNEHAARLKSAGYPQDVLEGVMLTWEEGDMPFTAYSPTVEELYYELDRITKRFKIINDHNEISIGAVCLDGETVVHQHGGQLIDVLANAWGKVMAESKQVGEA